MNMCLKEQTSSNSSIPAEYGGGYIQTILFSLFGIIQLTNKMICISQIQHIKIPGFQIPWVPKVFFFCSEAAIVSGEAAIMILVRERKNPRQDHNRSQSQLSYEKNPLAPRVAFKRHHEKKEQQTTSRIFYF